MKKTLLAVSVLFALAGCNQSTPAYNQAQYAPAPQVVAAPAAAPVIVNQPAQDHTASNMLMGGALGYMLGRSHTNGGGSVGGDTVNRTTVNKTVVNKTVIVQNNHPAPVPAPAPSRFGAPTSYANAYKSVPVKAAPARTSFGSSYSSSRTVSFRRR